MPIYEYRCSDCDRVTSLFVRSTRTDVDACCEHCNSMNVSRVISPVSSLNKGQGIVDNPSESSFGEGHGDAYNDPRQIGRWVEQKFNEYGMDVPEETREMIDAARDGEMPDPVRDL